MSLPPSCHGPNQRAWDERARRADARARPASTEQLRHPLAWIDQFGWFEGGLSGKRVLCLAAGGGKHAPLCAAAGARVTVVDLSPGMLDLDRRVAAERGLQLEIIEGSMDRLDMLADARFDVVLQPVSTCYVCHLDAVYREVARVTRAGGLYVSQHKQPASLQADLAPTGRGYLVTEPYFQRPAPLPPVPDGCEHREAGTIEFLHRWEDLLGGLCRNGFVLEDLREPAHHDPLAVAGTFAHRSLFLPPFVVFKARRTSASPGGARRALILPD